MTFGFNAYPKFDETKIRRRKVPKCEPTKLRPAPHLASAAATDIEAELDAGGIGFTRVDRRADGIVAFIVDGVEVASVCAVSDEACVSIEMITSEFREALRAVVVEEESE